jgi:hypothetical protein
MEEAVMSGVRWQRGESKIGCILALIIFVGAVVVGVKTFPVVVNVGELQAEIEAQAERAGLPRHNDKFIRRRIVEKAEELHLPVRPEMIEIERRKNDITIHLEYDVVLDYPFYTYRWHKVHHVMRPLF